MKYFFITLAALAFFIQSAYSQSSPQLINYQAVARNQGGAPMVLTQLYVRFSIHSGTANGPMVYQETHTTMTNQLGLFSLHIGGGTPIQPSGPFSAIQWPTAAHFLKVEMGQSPASYNTMGTSEMISVPYALYGEDADADPANEIQSLSQSGDTIFLSNSGFIVMADDVIDADADPANEIQMLTQSGDTIFLSSGGFVVVADDVIDADADPSNEIQVLSQSGDTIFLSSGGFVVVTDDVIDADADPSNEIQMLTQSGDTIFLSNGGFVVVTDDVIDADADPSNEIQVLSQSGDTIFLSNGGFVVVTDDVIDADADPSNEIQMLSQSGDTIFLSNGGFVVVTDDVIDADADPSNEIQMLSQSGDTIFLSNGGSVVVIDEVNDADADSTNELQDLVANSDGTLGISQGNGAFAYVPVGAILMWSGTNPPAGWALCDGANGTPDLRGRFIAGYDPNNVDYDNPGNFSTGGTTPGDTGGETAVLLTASESGLPPHVHQFTFSGSTDTTGSHRHAIRGMTGGNFGNNRYVDTGTRTNSNTTAYTEYAGNHSHHFTGSGVTMLSAPESAQSAHENRPEYWTLAYIMKLP